MIIAIVAITIITIIIVIMYYKSDTNLSSSSNLSMQLDKKNVMLSKSGIQMSEDYVPENDNDVITLKYMDDSILPNATTTSTGMIQLSGDLSGSATEPKIANNVIGVNNFSKLSQKNRVFGTVDNDMNVGELDIGYQLNIENNTLNVNKKLIYAMYGYMDSKHTGIMTDGDVISYYSDVNSIHKIQVSSNNVYISYDTTSHIYTIHGGINDCYIKVLYTVPLVLDNGEKFFSLNGFLDNIQIPNVTNAISAIGGRYFTVPFSILYLKINKQTDHEFCIKVINSNDIYTRGGGFICFEEM